MVFAVSNRINSTHLKFQIISQLSELRAYNEGEETFLTFECDVGVAVRKTYQDEFDSETMHLARTAAVLRKDIVSVSTKFEGSFSAEDQANIVPSSMLMLVNMILYGNNIKEQRNDKSNTQAVLTILQLLLYNSKINTRKQILMLSTTREHANLPLVIGLGLYIHTHTRQRKLVDRLFELGMCISYDRVLQISSNVVDATCKRYHEDNAVILSIEKRYFHNRCCR